MDQKLKTELLHRTHRFQSLLQAEELSLAVIQDRVSLLYYFGSIPGGLGIIPQTGEPLLLVRRGIDRAAVESPFSVSTFKSMKEIPALVRNICADRGLWGAELSRIPVTLFNSLQKAFPTVQWKNISPLIRTQRAVKSEYELELLREAGRRAADAYAQLPDLLTKPGLRELDVMAAFEAEMRKREHQGLIRVHGFNGELFYGIFSTGEAANAPVAFDGPVGTPGLSPAAPFGCSLKPLSTNEPIIMDVVFCYHGYSVDQTRIFVKGMLDQRLLQAYDAALHIQDRLTKTLIPGARGDELYRLGLEIAEDAGLKDYFMGFQSNRVSFIGHGIGLELDEFPLIAPRYTTPFEENSVIAIEPKFFLKGLGGIGIENTFRVTAHGGERLTPMSDDIVYLPLNS